MCGASDGVKRPAQRWGCSAKGPRDLVVVLLLYQAGVRLAMMLNVAFPKD
jgi:hypothetical protein